MFFVFQYLVVMAPRQLEVKDCSNSTLRHRVWISDVLEWNQELGSMIPGFPLNSGYSMILSS